jgi:Fe-S cluster assembly protein SufD
MIAASERDVYLSGFSSFEERLSEGERSPLRQLRRRAIRRFAELGFPTLKDEEWRFTNLAPLVRASFELGPEEAELPEAERRDVLAIGPDTFLLLVNGRPPQAPYNKRTLPDGVLVCGLAAALARHPELVEPHLARHADYEGHAFTALNTAFLRDGTSAKPKPVTFSSNVATRSWARFRTIVDTAWILCSETGLESCFS